MKKKLSLRIAVYLLLFLAFLGPSLPTATRAEPQDFTTQSQLVAPVDFHRFIVNNSQLGTLLTTNFQEGTSLNFAYYPFPQTAKIAVPPAAGWTPTPGQGLIPLYRYRISQNGRIYYGFFNGLASGSGYTFQGVAGYVFPGDGSFGGIALQAFYSQSKGYFYTVGTEVPIGYPFSNGFLYHGSPAYLPQGGLFSWDPPPICDADGSRRQQCLDDGGVWNQTTCSCRFINPCLTTSPTGAKTQIAPCLQREPEPFTTTKERDPIK